MRGFSRIISLIIGFVIAIFVIALLITIGDSGASSLEVFYGNNSNFGGG